MRAYLRTILLICCSGSLTVASAKAPALHNRIDAIIFARAEADQVPVAAVADDAEFLRRIYLDFAGTVPTATEARRFLADRSPDKRTKLIDALLDSPSYSRHMAERFDVMLMERRPRNDGWMTFLRTAFAENRPWDAMAAQIIHPDREHETLRYAAHFYTERLKKVGQQATDYPGLTRDVGRLFAGVDLQCAQCHRHLTVDDYEQVDFQGLFSIYLNIQISRNVKHPCIDEKLMDKPIEYVSVFLGKPKVTGPRVPGIDGEIPIPAFETEDDKWLVKPDRRKKVVGVPRFSPLRELAERLCTSDNPAFARNIANRLWAYMLGRGLVHPLDLHHSANPASHPKLLDALTRDVVDHNFDIRRMLRQIAMSKTYQRASMLPDGTDARNVPVNRFTVARQRRLTAEQLMWATLEATGERARFEQDADRMEDLRDRFVKALANPPKEPEESYAPSLSGALFLMNDETILDLLQPRDNNLIGRLMKMEHADAIAEELYLSILTRMPTDEERAGVSELLDRFGTTRPRKAAALAQVAWAMLASTEFAVNH